MNLGHIPVANTGSVKCFVRHTATHKEQLDSIRPTSDPGNELSRCLCQITFQGALPDDSDAPSGCA
jgi:hypothetical protein